MAKLKCKGSVLEQTVSSSFVAIAQVIGMSGPDMESETFDADTLENPDAGILYAPTGRTEGGSLSGDLFLDPALAGHQNMMALLTYPEAEIWKIKFADDAVTAWTFNGAGLSISPTIALNDGLKAGFGIKLSGLPTFAGSGSGA
jgi:hypothetical protein